MNKSRMGLVGVIVLVAGYLGATWIAGQVAHSRVNEFVARLEEQAKGQIRVVERKSTSGFFGSTEDITVGVDNPIFMALLGASNAPTQFTFHNEITHGPLPALRSIGVARIKSELVLSDEVRKTLKELLGTDEPVSVAVTLGWLGSTRIDINSPAMTVKEPKNGLMIDWKGMDLGINYSPHFDKVSMRGTIPSIKVTEKGGTEVSLDHLQMDADLKQHLEQLYVGDENFTIASVTFKQSTGNNNVMVKDIAYRIRMSAQDDFYNVGAKMGAASVDSQPIKVKDIHFDFAVNHLHSPTLIEAIKTYQEFSTQIRGAAVQKATTDASSEAEPATTPTETMESKLTNQIIELLKHDPEMVIEHVGFATDNGAIKLTGRAHFEALDASDLQPTPDPTKIMNKLAINADITFAQSLIDHWSIGVTPDAANQFLKQLETQGFVEHKGDQWQSRLEFKQGALTANGKKVER